MKYHIQTLGCKFNQYESARIGEILKAVGYTQASPEDADIVIINSCAVTSEAERQSLQAARHFKKINRNAKIIFTGCAVHDKEITEFDLVLGNGEKMRILDHIESHGTIKDTSYFLKDSMDYDVSKIPDHTRTFLSVENGCNWGCSYCAVPQFRGTKIRSKPIELAIREAGNMVKAGIKEIVVSGINIALYDDNGLKLRDLLKQFSKIEGDFRIRLSSIDPLSAIDLADNFFVGSKLCHHIHISLQSGSDNVLERMNRHYRSADIIKMVEIFRKIDGLFAFSADIIAGFPGESTADFVETFDLLKRIEVSKIHVFPFSPRPGTRAATMAAVDEMEKKERVQQLKMLSKDLERNFRKKLSGTTQKILVEKVENEFSEGLDDHHIRYILKYHSEIGQFIKCEV